MRYQIMMLCLRLKLAPAWLALQPGQRPRAVLLVFAAAAAAALIAILALGAPGADVPPAGRPCVPHATSPRHVTCVTPSPGGTP